MFLALVFLVEDALENIFGEFDVTTFREGSCTCMTERAFQRWPAIEMTGLKGTLILEMYAFMM